MTVVLAACVALPSIHARERPGEVWLALRDDHLSGKGTKDDPFDASTAEKLDALMPTIAPKASIHFLAGTFFTRGIQAKEGLARQRTGQGLNDDQIGGWHCDRRRRDNVYDYLKILFGGFLEVFRTPRSNARL